MHRFQYCPQDDGSMTLRFLIGNISETTPGFNNDYRLGRCYEVEKDMNEDEEICVKCLKVAVLTFYKKLPIDSKVTIFMNVETVDKSKKKLLMIDEDVFNQVNELFKESVISAFTNKFGEGTGDLFSDFFDSSCHDLYEAIQYKNAVNFLSKTENLDDELIKERMQIINMNDILNDFTFDNASEQFIHFVEFMRQHMIGILNTLNKHCVDNSDFIRSFNSMLDHINLVDLYMVYKMCEQPIIDEVNEGKYDLLLNEFKNKAMSMHIHEKRIKEKPFVEHSKQLRKGRGQSVTTDEAFNKLQEILNSDEILKLPKRKQVMAACKKVIKLNRLYDSKGNLLKADILYKNWMKKFPKNGTKKKKS